MFKPHSGRAFVKRLDSAAGANVAKEELAVVASRRSVVTKPAGATTSSCSSAEPARLPKSLPDLTGAASIDLVNHSRF